MVRYRFRGMHIDYCEGSHAVWLDADEIERATKTSRTDKNDSSKSVFASGLDAGVTANADSLLELLGKAVGKIFD